MKNGPSASSSKSLVGVFPSHSDRGRLRCTFQELLVPLFPTETPSHGTQSTHPLHPAAPHRPTARGYRKNPRMCSGDPDQVHMPGQGQGSGAFSGLHPCRMGRSALKSRTFREKRKDPPGYDHFWGLGRARMERAHCGGHDDSTLC